MPVSDHEAFAEKLDAETHLQPSGLGPAFEDKPHLGQATAKELLASKIDPGTALAQFFLLGAVELCRFHPTGLR